MVVNSSWQGLIERLCVIVLLLYISMARVLSRNHANLLKRLMVGQLTSDSLVVPQVFTLLILRFLKQILILHTKTLCI